MSTPKKNYQIISLKKIPLLACLGLLALLSAGCAQPDVLCAQHPWVDYSTVLEFTDDDQALFQFPLEELPYGHNARFCKGYGWDKERKYHAAEDYHLPAGTPVYAFADGKISYSGPMSGYGWLIIIDHPWADIYSLYGHLSPSRWKLESGEVKKGDLIGYLGDGDENGGDAEHPLATHLHFGIRVGQRRDYSGFGEWRWMAGWIQLCPSDLGWLQPSRVIMSQELPADMTPKVQASLLDQWGFELLYGSAYLVSGGFFFLRFRKAKKPLGLILFGLLAIVAGVFFSRKGTWVNLELILLGCSALLLLSIHYLQGRNLKVKANQ